MKDTLFLQHCDPRQNFNEKQVLTLLNLHALLFKELVIQDNFLVSKLFYDIDKISPEQSFQTLFYEKILNVASRDNLEYSILNLKNDLQSKAIKGLYMPFEGQQGIELYQQADFENYIKQLDKNLKSQKKNFKSWSTDDLGRNLRKLMLESAENGTSGLEPEIAKNVVNSIDQIAFKNHKDLIHSRSMYFDYVKSLENKELADKIWAWISLVYLKNLPDKLSVGLSLSSQTLTNEYSYDPFEFTHKNLELNKSNIVGTVNATILNPDFLINIHPNSILKIREFDEFKLLQKEFEKNDEKGISITLTNYLTRLSNEAPKFYEPFRKKIRKLEILEKTKINLVQIFDLYSIFSPEPINAKIIKGLSFVLSKNKTIETKKEKEIQLSKNELYKKKLDNEIKNVADLCHHLDNDNGLNDK
jgi:hypothetical protein